ncbi:MAG TPA: condensation domain-containing protein [Pseudonocardiaceae bacterium]|jgi:hypothetical protein
MVDRIIVGFAAQDDGGVEELSWGQHSIWQSMTDAGSSLPVGDYVAVPPGTTVETSVNILRYVMNRHQSLRTHIVVGDDGVRAQHIATSGEVPLEIIDAGATDPADVARQTMDQYYAEPFDYVDEWPIRMAAVRQGDAVKYIVAVYCHIAVDVHGVDALVKDLASMDPVTGEPTGPVLGLPPIEQVRLQRRPGAIRHSEAAIRYAERLVRDIPARRYNISADPREPRWWQINLDSRASYLAGRSIAARNKVHTNPVLLAAFAVAFSEITGINPAVAQLVVNNRFRPGLALAVAPISEACLGVIDVEDSTFDQVVSKAWQASTRAGKHSYYDPFRMEEMLATVARERGEEIDIDCYFNDRRRAFLNPPSLEREPTRAEIEAAREETTLGWADPMELYDHTMFFHINDIPDTFDYLMCADTHRLAPAEMETMMLRIEDVLVAAVLDPDEPVGVRSLSRKVASVEY